MKQVQVTDFGAPEVMKINNVDKPQIKPNEMLVQVKAAGVNPVEAYLREGNPRYPRANLPFPLGTDYSGVVVQVGSEFSNDRIRVGSNVFGIMLTKKGTYQEFISVNPQTELVGIIPENLTFEQAAGFGVPFLTAYQGLVHTANVQPGQTVLVHGASGGVGLAAIQVAVGLGANVIATAGTDLGENNCKAVGATQVFNHSKSGYEKDLKSFAEANYGGVDVIFENVTHQNLDRDFEIAKKGTTILIVGAKTPCTADIPTIFYKELKVLGVRGFSMTPANKAAMIADFEKKVQNGTYKPIVATFPLSDVINVHHEVERPKSGGVSGKIVLTI